MSGTYEEQAFKNAHGLEKLVLGGWQANIIWIWNAGSPFSITDNYTGQGNSLYGPAGLSPGPNRPLQIGNPKLAHRTINQWFNPLAFETPLDGQPGNTHATASPAPPLSTLMSRSSKRSPSLVVSTWSSVPRRST